MDDIELIPTSDGSHSLLNKALKETYHSVHGAIQESRYVYIQNGLYLKTAESGRKEIRILEIGFGTGLNVLLTALEPVEQNIYYQSWELYPIEDSLAQQLNYGEKLSNPSLFVRIHEAEWNKSVEIRKSLTLFKKSGNIISDELAGPFDIIYYDAFAPAKQMEMWTFDVLKKVTDTLNPAGVLVTYCARGQVKRDLALLGLVVETLPGPPGKKEMIRATKPA